MESIALIESLIEQHDRYRLMIGRELALLKHDWELAHGQGLNASQKQRKWLAFLSDCHFINPNHLSAFEWISPSEAEKLIVLYQRHLLDKEISDHCGTAGDITS